MSDRPFVPLGEITHARDHSSRVIPLWVNGSPPLDAITHARDHSSRVIPLWVNGSPPLELSLSDHTLAFGGRLINTQSAPLKLTLKNTGFRPLTFKEFRVVGSDFAIMTAVPTKLKPGQSFDIYLTFTPSVYTESVGKLLIQTNQKLSYEVRMIGMGIWDHIEVVDQMLDGLWDFILRSVRPALVEIGPQLSLSNTTVLFADEVEVGSQSGIMTVTISNAGNRDLVIGDLNISGDYEIIP